MDILCPVCMYECSARLQAEDLSVTCTVNGNEDSTSTISYLINGGTSVDGTWFNNHK